MCEPSPVWCLPETLKLYVTQVVVEPAVGDRKPEASLNRQVFFVVFFYPFKSIRGTVGAKDSVRMHMSTEHVTEHLLMPVQLYF